MSNTVGLLLGANPPMKPSCSQSSQSGRCVWDIFPGWRRLPFSKVLLLHVGVVFACSSATDGAPDNCQYRHSTSKGVPPWKQWNLSFLLLPSGRSIQSLMRFGDVDMLVCSAYPSLGITLCFGYDVSKLFDNHVPEGGNALGQLHESEV